MAIQNYKKFINKRQNDELTDITPDFGELVVGKDRVIVGLGDNTIYNTKEKELELERLQYYGNANIVPNESYFTVNGSTITGLTETGKAQTGTLVIPYKINGVEITQLQGNIISFTSILNGASDKITKVILPNSINNIGVASFYGCTALTEINIPDSVTNIQNHAFNGCTSLESINISNNVTNIGLVAFNGCTSLETIKIPNSVTSIGDNSFDNITLSQLTVYCEQGSYAETYAQEKGFNIVYTNLNKNELVGEKTEDSGEIFNDYVNNVASGDYSHAEGYKTKAGMKSFQIISGAGTENAEGTYTLDSIKDIEINSSAIIIYLTEENIPKQMQSVGTITEIGATNKTITVSNYKSMPLPAYTYYISIESNPSLGTTKTMNYSHSEGIKTQALGYGSHAEGNNTITLGFNSHAEGEETKAEGIQSHAEGYGSTTKSQAGHAEGLSTTVTNEAFAAHAEGWLTTAYAPGSHAEGSSTQATGTFSHAEGKGTIANGFMSHTEGDTSQADGDASHAEGYKTKAYADYSHVEGKINWTYGIGSHAEGNNSNALTDYSHAEGQKTKAGRKCFKVIVASGTYGGEGTYTLDSVDNLTTNLTITLCESNGVGTTDIAQTYDIGKITAIDTTNKIITVDKFFTPTMNDENEDANADYYIYANNKPTYGTQTTIFINTHAEGQSTEAFGVYSHAEGYHSKSYGEASHAECASQANGKHSHSEGSGTTANGLYSHTEGFNTQTGLDNGAWAAHAEGWWTKALSTGAHSEGNFTYANKEYSHAEGDSSIANGASSHSEGKESTANTTASHAEGYKTNAGIKCFKITSGTGTLNGEGTYILDSVEGILTDYLNNITGTIIAINKRDTNKIPTGIKTIGTIIALDAETKTITVDNFKSLVPINDYYMYIDTVPNIGANHIINYAHAEGIETKAFGYGSHVEGHISTATGNYAHAENESIANGFYSHAEGTGTTNGSYAHAEGFMTTASNIGAHSEGSLTKAYGAYAHAEGFDTIAKSDHSHAEGNGTEANDVYAHAEGQGTKASAPAQHVEGKYNIVDDFGDYAHIIGNGESDTARSNALTVDWNGNLWIAGGLTFGMIDTLPTASASYRGKTIFKKDDTNGDKLYICIYNGSAYEWKEL